jgi:hypothetical protein
MTKAIRNPAIRFPTKLLIVKEVSKIDRPCILKKDICKKTEHFVVKIESKNFPVP